jgi:hypothetical protein
LSNEKLLIYQKKACNLLKINKLHVFFYFKQQFPV